MSSGPQKAISDPLAPRFAKPFRLAALRRLGVCGLLGLVALGLSLFLMGALGPAPALAAGSTTEVSGAFDQPVVQEGETFLLKAYTIDYQGGTAVASGSADGTAGFWVDDAIDVDVTHPNGSQTSFSHNFSNNCSGITGAGPFDLSSYLQTGKNTVVVRLYDICGGDEGVGTGVWLDFSDATVQQDVTVPPGSVLGGGGALRYDDTCVSGPGTVDCATGDMNDSFRDVSVPGPGGGLVVSRTYNSLDAGVSGQFGKGWSCSFCWSLSTDSSSGDVTVTEGDGSQVLAAPDGSGGYDVPAIYDSSLTENADGSWTFVRQHGDSYSFSSSGVLTAVTDRNGYATSLSYSGGVLSAITSADGQSLTVATNSSGQVTAITDPLGHETTYGYDSSGDLTSVTDSDGDEWQYGYNSVGDMTTLEDPDENITTTTFDSENRVLTQTQHSGAETQYAYSGDPFSGTGGITLITDPDGDEEQQQYSDGELTSLTKGYGTSGAQTWSYGYDPLTGGLTSSENPNGKTTTYTYDADGNMLTKTDPSGDEWEWTYNAFDEVLSAEDPDGVTTTNTYNSDGDLLTSSTPLLNGSGATIGTQETQYSYGNSSLPGYPTAIENPDDKTSEYSYGSRGQLSSVTNPLGDESSFSYDADGRMLTAVSAKGNVSGCGCAASYTTTYTYNDLNEPLTISDPDGHETRYVYDDDGNLTTLTKPDGSETVSSYNDLGEVTEVQQKTASGTVTQMTSSGYDADGNLTSQTDGNGDETTYSYNALGQESSTTNPVSKTTSYTYDPDGSLATETTPDGATVSDSYNQDDELTGTSYSGGHPAAVSYGYDPDGRMTAMSDGTGSSSWTYNSLGQLTGTTNGAGQSVSYGYDLAGNITSITYPGTAGHTVDYVYNDAGEESSVSDWLGNSTSFHYDADGNLTSTVLPGQITDASSYDDDDNLLSTDVASTTIPTNPYTKLTYTYNADDQIGSETDSGEPPAIDYSPGNTSSFGYDQANNLTGAGSGTQAFNAASELCWQTTASSSNSCTSAPSGATGYSYDSDGNRTALTPSSGSATSYSYDAADELTSVTTGTSTVASDSYDGTGLRASETVAGTTYHFAYDTVAATPLILTDGQDSYIYGPNSTPIEQISSDGTELYLHHDALGSVRSITNQTGSVVATFTYTPYGTLAASTGTSTSRFGYAGAYTDPETGLLYLHARFYDPTTGQFMSVDPLVEQTQQPYAYAGDDPINAIDPTGLACGVSTSSVGSFFSSLGGDITGCPEAAASTAWNYTGGAAYNYLSTHTIGLCADFSGGAGVVGTAQGCVALVGGSPTLIGSLGFGAGSPSVQISGGLLVSNAQSACELNGWFGNVDGSFGEGPTLGDQVSEGQTSSGRNIWENQVTAGLGISLPTPFQLHGGASYTWTS